VGGAEGTQYKHGPVVAAGPPSHRCSLAASAVAVGWSPQAGHLSPVVGSGAPTACGRCALPSRVWHRVGPASPASTFAARLRPLQSCAFERPEAASPISRCARCGVEARRGGVQVRRLLIPVGSWCRERVWSLAAGTPVQALQADHPHAVATPYCSPQQWQWKDSGKSPGFPSALVSETPPDSGCQYCRLREEPTGCPAEDCLTHVRGHRRTALSTGQTDSICSRSSRGFRVQGRRCSW